MTFHVSFGLKRTSPSPLLTREIFAIVRRINADQGSTIVMVLHDLSLAARYSDRLVVLHEGRVLADGEPWQVITPEVLAAAFGLEALVIADPASGRPMVVPLEPTTAGAAESEQRYAFSLRPEGQALHDPCVKRRGRHARR